MHWYVVRSRPWLVCLMDESILHLFKNRQAHCFYLADLHVLTHELLSHKTCCVIHLPANLDLFLAKFVCIFQALVLISLNLSELMRAPLD